VVAWVFLPVAVQKGLGSVPDPVPQLPGLSEAEQKLHRRRPTKSFKRSPDHVSKQDATQTLIDAVVHGSRADVEKWLPHADVTLGDSLAFRTAVVQGHHGVLDLLASKSNVHVNDNEALGVALIQMERHQNVAYWQDGPWGFTRLMMSRLLSHYSNEDVATVVRKLHREKEFATLDHATPWIPKTVQENMLHSSTTATPKESPDNRMAPSLDRPVKTTVEALSPGPSRQRRP
jgi:hypothetical protein